MPAIFEGDRHKHSFGAATCRVTGVESRTAGTGEVVYIERDHPRLRNFLDISGWMLEKGLKIFKKF